MAISTKVLKNRISSIKNTEKITKAMELVAASKMKKAVNNVLVSRNYSEIAWQMLKRLRTKTDESLHKLLESKKQIKNILIILITSNRGLCGGYNSQIINTTIKSIKSSSEETKTDIIIIGKKGRSVSYKFKQNVIAEFDKEDVINQVNEIFPISKMILDDYMSDKYDCVKVAFTDFVSSLKQIPRVRQILPILDKDEFIGQINEDKNEKEFEKIKATTLNYEYIYEPSPEIVLKELLPRIIEVQIYQAYLEANASEHSARMMAMKNASDSAKEMIDDLSLRFNQSRQAGITQEIAEISAGKAVLE